MLASLVRARGRPIIGLGRIRTYLLLAHLFAVLALVGFFLILVAYLWVDSANHRLGLAGPVVLVVILLGLPTILVILRIAAMRRALRQGEYLHLRNLDSLGVAVLALLFSGAVAGVFLLLVHHRLADTPGESVPPSDREYAY